MEYKLMTRKHFEKLAAAIATIRDDAKRAEFARIVGAVCQSCNDRFDWSRWDVACNIGADTND